MLFNQRIIGQSWLACIAEIIFPISMVRVLVSVFLLCLALQDDIYGQGLVLKVYWPSNSATDSNLVHQAIGTINSMLAERDLSFAKAAADGFTPDFAQFAPSAAGLLYANLVENLLRMAPAGDRSSARPVARYTESGLAFGGSVELFIEQVLLVQASKAAWLARGDGFPELRRAAAENWINTWSRMADYFGGSHEESALIENRFRNAVPLEPQPWPFSPDRMDSLPTNFTWISGMGPAAIKDPTMREDYERALSLWRDDEDRKGAMIDLVRNYAAFGQAMEFWLKDLYTTDPTKRLELVEIIERRVTNPELQGRLADRLKLPKDVFASTRGGAPRESGMKKASSNGGPAPGGRTNFWLRPPPVAGVRAISSRVGVSDLPPKIAGVSPGTVKNGGSLNQATVLAPPTSSDAAPPASPLSLPYLPLAGVLAAGLVLGWFLLRSRAS